MSIFEKIHNEDPHCPNFINKKPFTILITKLKENLVKKKFFEKNAIKKLYKTLCIPNCSTE